MGVGFSSSPPKCLGSSGINSTSANLCIRMKIFLVTFFLTITFLSQSWGKHYLVKTKGDKTKDVESRDAKYKKGLDELDINDNAKTLIYTGLDDEELKAFKRMPKKKKKMIIKDIDEIVDNVRNGIEDMDLNTKVMKQIKDITGGESKVQHGLMSLLKLMPGDE